MHTSSRKWTPGHTGVARRYGVRLLQGRARVQAPLNPAIFHLPTYFSCTSPDPSLACCTCFAYQLDKNKVGSPEKKKNPWSSGDWWVFNPLSHRDSLNLLHLARSSKGSAIFPKRWWQNQHEHLPIPLICEGLNPTPAKRETKSYAPIFLPWLYLLIRAAPGRK